MPRVLAFLLSLPGCIEPTPRTLESCEGLHAACAGAELLQTCEDGIWVDRSCDDVCSAADPGSHASGCLLIPDSDDACRCMNYASNEPEEPGPCELDPTLATCVSPRSLSRCVEGDLVETPCADFCPDAVDVGCFRDPAAEVDFCACASAGDTCEPVGYPTCVDDAVLTCSAGTWTISECPDCPDGSSACGTDALGVGACRCN